MSFSSEVKSYISSPHRPDVTPEEGGLIWEPGGDGVEVWSSIDEYLEYENSARAMLSGEHICDDETDALALARHISQTDVLDIYPTEWTELSVRMPNLDFDETTGMPIDGNRVVPFTYEGREYLKDIYDLSARRVLLMFGRQSEKSTTLGNKILSYMCTIPHYRCLYVSPTLKQTKTFRRDRIAGPMSLSNILQSYVTPRSLNNISSLQLINHAIALFFYAFLTADRIRGNVAWGIFLDEFQNILTELIPVIEECSFHAPQAYRSFTYSGTPLSMDNVIQYYWENYSTQNEWAVPCDCRSIHLMGKGNAKANSSNILWNAPLGMANIGLKGMICASCGNLINARDSRCDWVSMNAKVRDDKEIDAFEGFRVPQIAVPWVDWTDLLHKRASYPEAQFFNECLAQSYDSGTRPLSTEDLQKNSAPELDMLKGELYWARATQGFHTCMGIDWGTGEKSYTVVCFGGYLRGGSLDGKFVIFYWKKYTGALLNIEAQVDDIIRLIRLFKPNHVGVDYGVGQDRNQKLINIFGPQIVTRYQYVGSGYGSSKRKLEYDTKLGRYIVSRTDVMTDVFTAIKENKLMFPKWEQWREPFGMEMLGIFSEYDERMRAIRYDKNPNTPDDSFHALVYCLLASNARHPRVDIFRPQQIPFRGPR